MAFIGSKRGKKHKYRNFNKVCCDRMKVDLIEVRSDKCNNSTTVKMEANTFWENYKAAYEWQKRHNNTWWKTRCFALEHENHILKGTIRNLLRNQSYSYIPWNDSGYTDLSIKLNKNKNDSDNKIVDENIEFHLNEDMMTFLAQSIQHKIELRNKRQSVDGSDKNKLKSNSIKKSNSISFLERSKEAVLFYGKQSSKILAMETALQTTMERHIDKKKPQYWPNIPLKL